MSSKRLFSDIAQPLWKRKGVPCYTANILPVWLLVGLVAMAGLLTSGPSQSGAGVPIKMAAATPPATLAGQLLVAREALRDPRFFHSVVYVIHHDAGGSMGLIVNRPIGETALSELLEQAGIEGTGVKRKIRVHFGGPVQPERGFVLHTADYKIEGTTVVKDSIAVTTQPEILLAVGTRTGPRQSLFALGYAGWAPGQLESEIKAGAWEIVPADEGLVFDEPAETKWDRAMARRPIRL